MPDEEPIVVVPYDPRWSTEFREMGGLLRGALRETAVRIDHVGSTSVVGLDAKPVIDIQVSVLQLEPDTSFRGPMDELGFVYWPTNVDRSKRFFREPPGARRTHVHVRRAGSFDEQLNLLLRDYLRTHSEACRTYASVKHELATRFRHDRDGYVRAKAATVWSLLSQAHEWLQEVGWQPTASDA